MCHIPGKAAANFPRAAATGYDVCHYQDHHTAYTDLDIYPIMLIYHGGTVVHLMTLA